MRKHSVLTRKGGLHGLHGAYWCSCTLQAPTLGNAPACSTCECSVWRSLDSNRLSAQQRPTVALEARACMAASGVDRYWEAGLSVQERFGEISGLTGQRIIFRTYRIGSENRTLQFFTEDGKRNLLPHELNTRKHDVVKNAYKKSITTNGLVRGVRGEPWAVASPDGGGPYKMIAAATLVQAFFEVEQEMPTNPQVVATKAAGLQGCLVLNHETPPGGLEVVARLPQLLPHRCTHLRGRAAAGLGNLNFGAEGHLGLALFCLLSPSPSGRPPF